MAQRKTIPLLILFPLFVITVVCLSCAIVKQAPAATNNCTEVLKKVSARMALTPNISYIQYKHVYNGTSNYEVRDTAAVFFSYLTNKAMPAFQIRSRLSNETNIYNHTEFFTLYDKERSYNLIADSSKVLPASTHLFRQSWANIRNILPDVVQNDSISKVLRDTVMEGNACYAVHFYHPNKRFNAWMGYTAMETTKIKWRYELIIDKKSMLPSQFNVYIDTEGDKTPNYIHISYANMDAEPTPPAPGSWYFSSYAKDYPAYLGHQKRNPLIKAGDQLPDWKLPLFSTGKDTLRSMTFKDKTTLLVFWIKNCGYSQEALPQLREIQTRFVGRQFQLIAINCHDPENEMKFFHNKLIPNYPMCFEGQSFSESIGIYAYPIALLVKSSGKVMQVFQGFDKETINGKISATLSDSSGQ